MNEIGHCIKEKPELNVVFVNSALTTMQIKKLEKRWNDIIQENDDRLRAYFLKSANKDGAYSPTEIESDTEMSAMDLSQEEHDELMSE